MGIGKFQYDFHLDIGIFRDILKVEDLTLNRYQHNWNCWKASLATTLNFSNDAEVLMVISFITKTSYPKLTVETKQYSMNPHSNITG